MVDSIPYRWKRGQFDIVFDIVCPVVVEWAQPSVQPRPTAYTHHEVAAREEDDGPLGVLEALPVDEEGGDGHEGGERAQPGPQRDPHLGEVLFLLGEEDPAAGEGAVLHAGHADVAVVPRRVPLQRHQRPAAPAAANTQTSQYTKQN